MKRLRSAGMVAGLLALGACESRVPSDFAIALRVGCGMKKAERTFAISQSSCTLKWSCDEDRERPCVAGGATLATLYRAAIAQGAATLPSYASEGDGPRTALSLTLAGKPRHVSCGDGNRCTADESRRYRELLAAVNAAIDPLSVTAR